MKKRPALDSDDEFFLGTFVNENVSIFLNSSMQHLDEGLEALVEKPITFAGVLLHMDKNFLYLGEDVNQIAFAIPRSAVAAIFFTRYTEEENPLADMSTVGSMS